jgi:hypothetical protein
MTVADYTGSFGVGMLLLAYLLTLLKTLKTTDKIFTWMNIIGATFACLASVMIRYVPFIVLEGTWALVSVASLFRRSGKV